MIESIQALTIFLYLLPGILGYFFYELLAERSPSDSWYRVAAIISITFFAVLLGKLISKPLGIDHAILPKTPENGGIPDIFASFFGTSFLIICLVAMVIGVIAARTANSNYINQVLGKVAGTSKTGKADVWHQVFTTFDNHWCRIRYKNGSLLIGYPKYYSMKNNEVALFVGKAAWYLPDGLGFKELEIKGEGVLITEFEDIIAIDVLHSL